MQAARLQEGTVVVQTVAIPEPKVGEARIKIIQAGICNTDVELTRGYHCLCSNLCWALMHAKCMQFMEAWTVSQVPYSPATFAVFL